MTSKFWKWTIHINQFNQFVHLQFLALHDFASHCPFFLKFSYQISPTHWKHIFKRISKKKTQLKDTKSIINPWRCINPQAQEQRGQKGFDLKSWEPKEVVQWIWRSVVLPDFPGGKKMALRFLWKNRNHSSKMWKFQKISDSWLWRCIVEVVCFLLARSYNANMLFFVVSPIPVS